MAEIHTIGSEPLLESVLAALTGSGARERARSGQGLDRPGAEIMRIPAAPGRDQPSTYTPSLLDFALPIVALLSVAVIPVVFFDQNRIDEASLK